MSKCEACGWTYKNSPHYRSDLWCGGCDRIPVDIRCAMVRLRETLQSDARRKATTMPNRTPEYILSDARLTEIEARLEHYDEVTLLEVAETLLDEVQRMKNVDRHLAFLRETIEAIIDMVDLNSPLATVPEIYGILSRAQLAIIERP